MTFLPKSALFWEYTQQRKVAVLYRYFGTVFR